MPLKLDALVPGPLVHVTSHCLLSSFPVIYISTLCYCAASALEKGLAGPIIILERGGGCKHSGLYAFL